jgi:HD-GYP domain-containing protein (c-di-GMP phosphodiesterase class II)
MPTPDEILEPLDGEISIDAAQLRPGVHVRLPVPWMQHHFLFSSFVIGDEDQVRQIAALKLPRLYCDITRCKVPPLPKAVAPAPVAEADAQEKARLAALAARQMAEKRERAQAMTELRGRLDTAQKHYGSAAKAVGGAIKSFDLDPRESVRQVTRVSEDSTAALLSDPDSALVLIAEKARDEGSAAHSLSVMTLTLLLGKQARLPSEALCALGIGALLHDVGKSSIKPSILRNPERNKFEEEIYQTHCRLGYESALRAGSLSQPMLDAILHHHERFDGGGFPDGLAGDATPLSARAVAIADRFDNLANPIDYRHALSPSEALSRMWTRERKAFDAVLLQLFIRAMGVYPPGSIVQLSDGRIGAVVASAPTGSPLSPQVMIHDPTVPRSEAIIVDLTQHEAITIEKPLRLQDRPDDELDYLLPRRKLNWFHMAVEKQGAGE